MPLSQELAEAALAEHKAEGSGWGQAGEGGPGPALHAQRCNGALKWAQVQAGVQACVTLCVAMPAALAPTLARVQGRAPSHCPAWLSLQEPRGSVGAARPGEPGWLTPLMLHMQGATARSLLPPGCPGGQAVSISPLPRSALPSSCSSG